MAEEHSESEGESLDEASDQAEDEEDSTEELLRQKEKELEALRKADEERKKKMGENKVHRRPKRLWLTYAQAE